MFARKGVDGNCAVDGRRGRFSWLFTSARARAHHRVRVRVASLLLCSMFAFRFRRLRACSAPLRVSGAADHAADRQVTAALAGTLQSANPALRSGYMNARVRIACAG